jgi:glutamine amidotransferase
MRVTLVDSPFANLRSIARALEAAGAEVAVTAEPEAVAAASKVVLPGVGSFAPAVAWLRERGLDAALRDAAGRGAALLGICVGHQLLFEHSDEGGGSRGLGLLEGAVSRFPDDAVYVPQIGWNALRIGGSGRLLDGLRPGDAVYFVNSYRVAASPDAVAHASYGGEFVAAVERRNVFGVQFHPEKSSATGLRILANFVRLAAPREKGALA